VTGADPRYDAAPTPEQQFEAYRYLEDCTFGWLVEVWRALREFDHDRAARAGEELALVVDDLRAVLQAMARARPPRGGPVGVPV